MLAFKKEKLGCEAYWTPIGGAELSDLPEIIFRSVPDPKSIASMWAFATTVFDLPMATPIGQFFFLVDAQRGSTLSIYCLGEEATRPIWIPTVDVDHAAGVLYEHCRNIRWQTGS